ncbi:hypothetical protein LCGC14_0195800 [marine sediment metagenome]|uniref:Uncharacterized protein n=1 Tax=marine sediment metagenome TaxID=412755 RepID=A0A0F9V1Z8_9ZZZZ
MKIKNFQLDGKNKSRYTGVIIKHPKNCCWGLSFKSIGLRFKDKTKWIALVIKNWLDDNAFRKNEKCLNIWRSEIEDYYKK